MQDKEAVLKTDPLSMPDRKTAPTGQAAWLPLVHFLKRHWRLYLLGLIASLGVALFESVNIGLVFPLLSMLFETAEAEARGGRLILWLNKGIALFPIQEKVIAVCVLLIAASLCKFIFSLLGEYLAAYTSTKVLHETKRMLLEKYFRLPYGFFLERKHGDLVYTVITSAQSVANALWLLPLGVTELVKILAILALLMLIQPQMTLWMLALGLGFYAIISRIAHRLSYTVGRLASERQMEQINLLDEMFRGAKHILIYRVLSHWMERFKKSSQAQSAHQTQQRLLGGMPRIILEAGVMVLLFGAILVLRLISPAHFAQYLPFMGLLGMAVIKFLPSLNTVSRARLDIMAHLANVEWVYDALALAEGPAREKGQRFSSLDHSILFEDVHFGYSDREPIFQGLRVSFEKNRVTAIVGGSGEGKTTLINILLGLYEPQKGRILIDGRDLREHDLKTWREKIALVSQEPFMLHATITENIAFGDSAFSSEQIVEAARIANADEFIGQMPQGYETLVGERGMKLSGGEQQRIAIARAILRKPEILIFDEATSALDNISERLVQEAIARIARDRTVVVVAHRLSTIQNADKIVVLEKGRCAEEGTHEQLMRRDGIYSNQARARGSPGPENRTVPQEK